MAKFADYDPDPDTRGLLPDDLMIEEAREGDLDGIARLAAIRDRSRITEARKRFGRVLDDPGGGVLLVARSGGFVLAYGRVVQRLSDPPGREPPGWYLMGIVVDPAHRRAGIGRRMTRARLDWIRCRDPDGAHDVHYFCNALNPASTRMHAEFGFEEIGRSRDYFGIRFSGGEGILYRLSGAARRS